MINRTDIRKTPKIYVEWVDSAARGGWQTPVTADEKDTANIATVGFLIRENKSELTVSTSISDDGGVMDPLTIPKCAITKRRKI